jgi:hypothetical protein
VNGFMNMRWLFDGLRRCRRFIDGQRWLAECGQLMAPPPLSASKRQTP